MLRVRGGIVAVTALAIGVGLTSGAGGTATASGFCEFGIYTSWNDLSYKGERLVFPSLYGRKSRRAQNGRSIDHHEGFIVWADVDGFTTRGYPLGPDGLRHPLRPIGSPKDGRVAVHVGSGRPPAEIARVRAALYAHTPETPAKDAASALPLDSYPLVARSDGLVEVAHRSDLGATLDERAANGPTRGWAVSAVYFHRDTDGSIDTSVTCEARKGAANQCVLTHEVGPFSVQIGHDRAELLNWRQLRSASVRFIECARAKGREAGAARPPPETPLSPRRRRDGTPFDENETPRPFCDFPGRYARWSDMTFQGVRLIVPTAYELRERQDRGGGPVEGFIGSATMPDFRPTLSTADRPADPTQVSFLMTDLRPLEQIARLHASRTTELDRLPPEELPPATHWRLIPGPAGLTEVASPRSIEGAIARFPHHRDLDAKYVHFDAMGDPDVVVDCGFGTSPLNTCTQTFEIGPSTIRMHYRRDELPYWREIRAGMERMVDCASALGRGASPVPETGKR